MKIALVAPTYPLAEAPSPPLGLCYVAAACEAAGATVRIFDYIVSRYTPEKLHAQLDEFAPDILGATAVTMNIKAAEGIVGEARRHRPQLITLMGGPHASFSVHETFNSCPELDLIIIGEGEQTLAELLPVIHDRRRWPEITGIAFRDGQDIHTTAPRPLLDNLDSLPLPARHLLPLSRYQALGFPVSIITSRGCPNRCIFCLGRRMVGFRVRHRSPRLVVDEIEQLLDMGFERINIADDIFTADKQRVKQLCTAIIQRRRPFTWSAFSRVNTVDRETLEIMQRAGCDSVSFGVESGNPEMLKRVKKGITLDQARRATGLCRELGIHTHASFMVGLPGETPETLDDTATFARELDIEYGFHLLAPFPGTTVREELDQYDLEILTDDWNRYDANQAVVRTSALTAAEMDDFVQTFEDAQEEEWTRIKERHYRGEATPMEGLRVLGHRRMKLIFRILQEDLIEAAIDLPGCDEDPLDGMTEMVTAHTGEEQDFVRLVLDSLVRSGLLSRETTGTRVSWRWTDNAGLPVANGQDVGGHLADTTAPEHPEGAGHGQLVEEA